MGLSPQAKPCETMPLSISSQMPQLFGEFPSFPIRPLGQPAAWRLEGSFCSPKSRHHPLLTQFSFLGDTTRRDPSAQPSSSGSHCLHGPSDGPLQDGASSAALRTDPWRAKARGSSKVVGAGSRSGVHGEGWSVHPGHWLSILAQRPQGSCSSPLLGFPAGLKPGKDLVGLGRCPLGGAAVLVR